MKITAISIILSFLITVSASSVFASSNKGKAQKEGKATEEVAPQPAPEETTQKQPQTGTSSSGVSKQKKKGKGVIRGKVVDELGNPLIGVEVSCIDSNGVIIKKTFTDKKGVYIFNELGKGSYSINVNYSGFSSPVKIQFKKENKRPPIPTSLRVYELQSDIPGKSIIRTEWDKMSNTYAYRCELYQKGDRTPRVKYPAMKQNFCEFGNLEENNEYQVRVYAENQSGLSASYALGLIKTINRRPPAPYGLGFTFAKNNKIDLLWNGIAVDDLSGYILQVKKDDGKYLYYTSSGLTSDRTKAFIIPPGTKTPITLQIGEEVKNQNPLIENVTPYSFRVYAIDRYGLMSKSSYPLEKVVLEDTIPPLPPTDIGYEFIGVNRLKVTWKSKDTDVVKYRIYYGVTKNRWDGVITTNRDSYEFIISRDKLLNGELYIAVTAIDRAGNESGYKPIAKTAAVIDGEVEENIVLSHKSLYKDYSVTIQQPAKRITRVIAAKKKTKKVKPVYQAKYGFSQLAAKGFLVNRGETATITGTVTVPANKIIKVNAGGTLIIKGASIDTDGKLWGGVRYLNGAEGTVKNSIISHAAVGIAIIDTVKPFIMQGVKVIQCEENGIFISNSRAILSNVTVKTNKIGILSDNSNIRIENSSIESNGKGIRAHNYRTIIKQTNFTRNKEYGARLYGGGIIENCSFKKNLAGVIIEKGIGTVTISHSLFEQNTMDGLIIAGPGVEITKNEIVNNGRYGVYVRNNANPFIVENDIINNGEYGIAGGGKVIRCFVAYNNASPYIDDTKKKGNPDNIFSSSSNGVIKQIFNVDYIEELLLTSQIVAQSQ